MRLSADLFYISVAKYNAGPNRAIEVEGRPNFSGHQASTTLIFRNITFPKGISFEHAHIGGDLAFINCAFLGSVDLAGAVVAGDLMFKNCRFASQERQLGKMLVLNTCDVRGSVSFQSIHVFEGTLAMASADVGMDVSFYDCVLGPRAKNSDEQAEPEPANAASDTTILRLDQTKIRGSLFLGTTGALSRMENFDTASKRSGQKKLHILGSLSAHSIEVGGDVHIGPSEEPDDTNNVVCHGSLIVDHAQLKGQVGILSTQIKHDLQFDFARTGRISAFNMSVEGGASFVETHSGGRVDLVDSDFEWITFSSCQFPGQLFVERCAVKDQVDFNGSRLGSFIVGAQPGLKRGKKSQRFANRFGGLSIVDSQFTSYTRFSDLIVTKTGVEITGSSFGSDLSFWQKSHRVSLDRWEYTAFSPSCQRVRVDGEVKIRNCTIDGRLDLTKVITTIDGDKKCGIFIEHTDVKGAIRFRSPQSILADERGDSALQKAAKDYLLERSTDRKSAGSEPTLFKKYRPNDTHSFDALKEEVGALPSISVPWDRASAAFLQLNHVKAANVYLTGLDLWPTECARIDPRCGQLSATNLEVKDTFAVIAQMPKDVALDEKDLTQSANIPGSLRLDGSIISDLFISAHSFTSERTQKPSEFGIVLENAQVERLWVPRLTDEPHFPVPLDLSGLKVGQWHFSMDDDDLEKAINVRYVCDFLSNDTCLHRDLYRSVYQDLKNMGEEDAAKKVYRIEADRARMQGKRAHMQKAFTDYLAILWAPFVWIWNLIYKHLLRYGVDPSPLGVAMVLAFTFSAAFVAPNRDNFEIADPARILLLGADIPNCQAGSSQALAMGQGVDACLNDTTLAPSEWGFGTGLWMALRYHVPLIALGARSEFEATDDLPLTVFGLRFDWLTPDDYFHIMAILNWIALPVFLTFSLRQAVRD